jgi:uncharacterized protein YbjT (DUF2867 family)
MSKAKNLVTVATGNTGRAVTRQLLDAGHPVRAIVRSRDARSDALARAGAEVVEADLFDPISLTEAARGTQRAYYVPPYHEQRIQSAVAFATAAREAKLEVVVGMSQWTASPTHPALLSRQHWLADRMFSSLREVGYVKLDPGYFALGAPNDVVAGITGIPAESFEVTARRYAALPEARRGWSQTLRAPFDFLRTPFAPGYDLTALERAFPRPAEVQLSMTDDAWKRSHAPAPV